jgi:hypothetical protein
MSTEKLQHDGVKYDVQIDKMRDEESQPTTHYDEVETSRVLHKVDRRLLPVLAFLYLLSFLDRGNLGNAKVRTPSLLPLLSRIG